jgi:hypothetical protein
MILATRLELKGVWILTISTLASAVKDTLEKLVKLTLMIANLRLALMAEFVQIALALTNVHVQMDGLERDANMK